MEKNDSQGQEFSGNGWTAKKLSETYIVSLNNGATVMAALQDFLQNQNINSAQISGIGAVESCTLAFYNFETQQYDSQQTSNFRNLLQQNRLRR